MLRVLDPNIFNRSVVLEYCSGDRELRATGATYQRRSCIIHELSSFSATAVALQKIMKLCDVCCKWFGLTSRPLAFLYVLLHVSKLHTGLRPPDQFDCHDSISKWVGFSTKPSVLCLGECNMLCCIENERFLLVRLVTFY